MADEITDDAKLLRLVRLAISDPGSVTRREQLDDRVGGTAYESVSSWSARAVLAATLPHLAAERDAENTRLRTERDAWKAHATHLESRLFDIWVLTERPARKCNGLDHDDVSTVAELADAPSAPAALNKPASPSAPAQEGQTT